MKKLIKFYKRLSFAQGAAFAVSLTSVVGIAANSIPGFFTFTSGQVISSSQVNSNFDKLAQLIESNQSQTFVGTWNAVSNIPDIDATSPTSGEYYVVTTAGTHNSIAYAVGDWAIWNGTAWTKIQNAVSGVTSVYGRTGAIVKAEGDYLLTDLADVDLTTPPFAGQILQFNGSNWLAGTLPTLTETDPTIMNFAKTALPSCAVSEVLKSSSNTFVCASIFSGSPEKVMVTNGTGQLINSTVTTNELNYLTGANSNLQTQLDSKLNGGSFVDWSAAGVQTINLARVSFMVPSRVAVSNPSGFLDYAATTTNELNYLAGATSNIQTQLNGKVNINVPAPTVGSDAVNKVYADGLVTHFKANSSFTGLGYTTNYYSSNSGVGNSFVGAHAGTSNTSGFNNSFVGSNAGNANSSGSNNSYFGFDSGKMITTGTNNTGIGSFTLTSAGIKNYNTAIGANSMMSATTGGSNTAIGALALGNITTGSNNTVIGKNAGSQVGSNLGNILIGYNAGPTFSTGDDNIILGNNAGPAG